jgi:hypothetical protein
LEARTAENVGDFCGVWLRSKDGHTLEPAAYHHRDPEIVSTMREMLSILLRVGEGVSGRVVQT